MDSEYTLGVSIGQGRISPHIPYLMGFLSSHFANLNREQFKIFLSHASKCKTLETLTEVLHDLNETNKNLSIKNIIFYLSVQDREILNVYHPLKDVLSSVSDCRISYVHFSGSFYHPEIVGIHPLMTFTKEIKYPQHIYEDLPLKCDHQDWVRSHSSRLEYIPPEDKPLYHALCVMLGNFPQLLIDLISKKMPEKFDIQDFKYLISYSIQNVLEMGSKGLTGPHIRKDIETITKNLKSLEGTELKSVYTEMSEMFLKEASHA
ncbi:MAG: DUF2520 domain-containing protein [Bdellovibrionaceae bacterium]|nr:DUF2520 domain-containing protein [Pseudobdellovibrionaceae bacterium]